MLISFCLTPCFLMNIIKKGYSRFKLCTKDAGLEKGETLLCLFESFALIVGKDTLGHRMRVFNFKLKVGNKRRLGQVETQPSRSSFLAKITQIKKAAVFHPKPSIFFIFWKRSRRSKPHFVRRSARKLSALFSYQPLRLTPRYEVPRSTFILAKTVSATSA